MGGFHLLDLVIVALIGLAIFGPKALQSVARNAGKGLGHAKATKDKLMAELPVEEISRVAEKVPMSTHEAVRMLMASEKEEEKETK